MTSRIPRGRRRSCGFAWFAPPVPVPVSWTQAAHDYAASSSSARRASVGVRYPALGRGHHLHPDLGGNAVSVRGRRCMEPARGRLVDGAASANRAGPRRSRHGDPTEAADGCDPSLRSWLYTSIAFGKRCDEAGVRPSMGSVGDCFDNALCESFFATLECELLDRRTLRSRAQARLEVFEHIEGCTTHIVVIPPCSTARHSSTRGDSSLPAVTEKRSATFSVGRSMLPLTRTSALPEDRKSSGLYETGASPA